MTGIAVCMWKYFLSVDVSEQFRALKNFADYHRVGRDHESIITKLEMGALDPIEIELTENQIEGWFSPMLERVRKFANTFCVLTIKYPTSNEIWDVYMRNCKLPHLFLSLNDELSELTDNAARYQIMASRMCRLKVGDVYKLRGTFSGDPTWMYVQYKCERIDNWLSRVLKEPNPTTGDSVAARLYESATPVFARRFVASPSDPPLTIRNRRRLVRQCDDWLVSELGEKNLSDAIAPFGVSLQQWLKA